MTITAHVIKDSISNEGVRLTTLQLRYPKFIHGEFMTHRVFSRNASSSRAIPVERLIEDVRRNPVRPFSWGKNQRGMQAAEELGEADRLLAEGEWDSAMQAAIAHAKTLASMGVHKQTINRILEPYSHINVIVTATEWDNFFSLRCHEAAQPEMRVLAMCIRGAMAASSPTILNSEHWHLPYVDCQFDGVLQKFFIGDPRGPVDLDTAIKCSVARCARVSYLTHEGKTPTLTQDLYLYDRLVKAEPIHASPAEHQATPDKLVPVPMPPYKPSGPHRLEWDQRDDHGNLKGWVQYRKLLEQGGGV